MVAVVQLVRAPPCGGGCCGFKSHQPPQRTEISNILYFDNSVGFKIVGLMVLVRKLILEDL